MKVKDLFNINKEFSKFEILAGAEGLDRKITDIDVFEVPDGIYWTDEGEFNITTGYYYKDNPDDLIKVIEIQNEKKAAGIGIKLGRFINKIPKKVLDRANELDFPVISIPVNLGYGDIIWPVVSLLLGENSYDEYIINKFKKELHSTTKEKYYLNNMILLLNNYLNSDIYVIEKDHFNLIKSLPTEKDYSIIKDIFFKNNYLEKDRMLVKKINNKYYRVYKIFHHGHIYGYFGIVSDQYNEKKAALEMNFLKEIYAHIIIHILSYSKNKLEYIKSIDELFLKLIQGNYTGEEISLREETKLLGVDYYQDRIIFSIVQKSKINRHIKKELTLYLSRIFSNKIKDLYIVDEIDNIVMIMSPINMSKDNLDLIANEVINKIKLKYNKENFTIGISKECSSLKHIDAAYEEAIYAEKIGSSLDNKSIYFYDDYIVYHMMTKLHNHSAVKKIYRNIITKIRKESGNSSEELIKTIKYLVKYDFNITKASEKLFLHRNTLYKRIIKIQEIIGYDFEQPDTKFILQMVSKLDDLIN